MKRTILIGAVAIALAASACAESETGRVANGLDAKPGTATTTTLPSNLAGSGESSATTASSTTIAPPTTTTIAPPTTTVAPVAEQKFEALVRSLEVDATKVSGRMEVSMRMTGLDPQEFGLADGEIWFTSAFDSESGDSIFAMDGSSLIGAMKPQADEEGFDASVLGRSEIRRVGDRGFVYNPALIAMFGGETDWISMPLEGSEQYLDTSPDFPSDPATIIDSYEGAGASLETIGQEEANGVSTSHYRITLDTAGLREQMTASERESVPSSPLFAEGIVPLDLWVSADGYIIRMVLEINADMVEGSPGDEFGSLVVEFNMFDINEPIVVAPPPASDVTPIEDLDPFYELGLEG